MSTPLRLRRTLALANCSPSDVGRLKPTPDSLPHRTVPTPTVHARYGGTISNPGRRVRRYPTSLPTHTHALHLTLTINPYLRKSSHHTTNTTNITNPTPHHQNSFTYFYLSFHFHPSHHQFKSNNIFSPDIDVKNTMQEISPPDLQEIHRFAIKLGKDAGKILLSALERRRTGGDQPEEMAMEEKMNAVDIVTKTDNGKGLTIPFHPIWCK